MVQCESTLPTERCSRAPSRGSSVARREAGSRKTTNFRVREIELTRAFSGAGGI
jgi:hypothetical protein